MYISWRRELAIREAQENAAIMDTAYYRQAVRELGMSKADLEDTHNVRMALVRAQQLKEQARQ